MSKKRMGVILGLLVFAGAASLAVSRAHHAKSAVALDEGSLKSEIKKVSQEIKKLSRESSQLSRPLTRFAKGRVVVVDTAQSRLYLLNDSKVLLDAPCSTGKNLELTDPVDGRSWIFKTPRGGFRVQTKLEKPVWRKPDWAFIEEGKRPPTDPSARFEAGALGDYALGFGDGYFIHGTLYARSLGQNVTHGCVRLGDEDLELLFRQVPAGTPVVIF
jgi:L,D-transpeptidase YbiS